MVISVPRSCVSLNHGAHKHTTLADAGPKTRGADAWLPSIAKRARCLHPVVWVLLLPSQCIDHGGHRWSWLRSLRQALPFLLLHHQTQKTSSWFQKLAWRLLPIQTKTYRRPPLVLSSWVAAWMPRYPS